LRSNVRRRGYGAAVYANDNVASLKSGEAQHRAIIAGLQNETGDPAPFITRRKADRFLKRLGI
jgi:hypothetical protein